MKKILFTLTIAFCVAAVASVASSGAKNSNHPPAPDTTFRCWLLTAGVGSSPTCEPAIHQNLKKRPPLTSGFFL